MQITDIIRGTLSVAPGANTGLFIEIPGRVTDPLSRVMSRASVAGIADISDFLFVGFFDNGNPDAHQTYLGTREVEMVYTSTASGPIDVDIEIVFVEEPEPNVITYAN